MRMFILNYYSFWHCPKKKEKTLVRLNLSTRESQNFRQSRKAVIFAHFDFPQPPARKSDRPARRLNSGLRMLYENFAGIGITE
jgi:hypothetical protein